jgi:hypothetical protein
MKTKTIWILLTAMIIAGIALQSVNATEPFVDLHKNKALQSSDRQIASLSGSGEEVFGELRGHPNNYQMAMKGSNLSSGFTYYDSIKGMNYHSNYGAMGTMMKLQHMADWYVPISVPSKPAGSGEWATNWKMDFYDGVQAYDLWGDGWYQHIPTRGEEWINNKIAWSSHTRRLDQWANAEPAPLVSIFPI